MSEVSASRASELPEGVKKVPRGCVTGCLTLPFRMLYKSRYAILFLIFSSIPGHHPLPAKKEEFLREKFPPSERKRYGLQVKELDQPALSLLCTQIMTGDGLEGMLPDSMQSLGQALPSGAAITHSTMTLEKAGVDIADLDSQTQVTVVDMGAFQMRGVSMIYILPGGRKVFYR